jgi:hypothetical protein
MVNSVKSVYPTEKQTVNSVLAKSCEKYMLPVGFKRTTMVLAAAFLLQGCNGGGDDGERLSGVFLDSPVSGLRYATPTQHGLTDSDGTFYYKEGESVIFSIGELVFTEVEGAATLTPLELAQVDDIEDEKAVNLLRLLQTVDDDQDPENGITIPASAHESVTVPQFRFDGSLDVEEFLDNIVAQIHDDGRELVNEEDAVDHLINTLSVAAESEAVAQEAAPLTYLVEAGQEYDGAFLSVQGSGYSMNLGQNWEQGTVDQVNNVLQLKSEQNGNSFLTSDYDENNQMLFCIGKRPYPVADCADYGTLFVAFENESLAQAYTTEIEVAQEPELGAAEEEPDNNTGIDTEVDNSSTTDTTANVETPSAEQLAVTDTADAVGDTITDNTQDQTGVDAVDNVSEPPQTDTTVTDNTVSPVDNETPQPTVTQPQAAIVATTNCPSGLKAPVQFSVYANEPAGCTWDTFTSPGWSWTPGSAYQLSDNSVVASQGGTYTGEFTHTCTDNATGQQRNVTASCVVDVEDAPGLEDITDLFFVTGQSNAAGLETAYDPALDAPDSRVFAFTDLGWQVADLHQYWEHSIPGNFSAGDDTRSPYNSIAFQVSRAVAQKSDRVVGLVVLTAPGEGISHWDFNSEFSVQIREKATAALNALPNKNAFDAMIWMQGETDWLLEGTADPGATGFADTTGDEYKNYYPTKLFQLVSNLRGESWFKFDGRFICAETKKAGLNPHLMALNSDADPYTGCAAAADLPTRAGDAFGNHFSAPGLRTLGERLADVYLSMD